MPTLSALRLSAVQSMLALLVLLAVVSAPLPSSAAELTQTLMLEQSGAEVTTLQQALNQLGYLNTAPTGYFGRMTYDGLISFQIAAGLQASGRADQATREALARRLPGLFSPLTPTVSNWPEPFVPSTPTEVGQTGNEPPRVSFRSTRARVSAADTFRLEWSSRGATSCSASGGWTGSKATEGRLVVPSISAATTYALTCTGPGGSTTRSVTVSLVGSPSPAGPITRNNPPRLQFASDRIAVTSGSSVVLNWEAVNAVSCTATGGWTGRQPLAGSFTTRAITETTQFRLSCTNGRATVQRAIEVIVDGAATPPGSGSPSTPPVSQPPTPPPPQPPVQGGRFALYAGCEQPATTFSRTVFIDPNAGADTNPGTSAAPFRTLTGAMATKTLRSGDRIVLRAGEYGDTLIAGLRNPEFRDARVWTWLDFQPGARMTKLEIRDMSRWLITGGTFQATRGTMLMLSGGQQFVASGNTFSSGEGYASWDANRWLTQTAKAISARNARCTAILDNRISGVHFGIDVSSDSIPVSQNAMNTLVQGNRIQGFSGDGMRPLASNVTIRNNAILDSYLGSADGDANHDDGIQMFALNGKVHDNIVLENNWIQETTNPTRRLIGPMQGIGHFDGPLTRFRVVNNVVITSVWHGIASGAPADSVIEQNTVVNYTTNGRQSWVRVGLGKGGESPSNTVVRNNVARRVSGVTGTTLTNNVQLPDGAGPAAFMTFDPAGNRYDLRPRAGGPIAGTGAGATLTQPAP